MAILLLLILFWFLCNIIMEAQNPGPASAATAVGASDTLSAADAPHVATVTVVSEVREEPVHSGGDDAAATAEVSASNAQITSAPSADAPPTSTADASQDTSASPAERLLRQYNYAFNPDGILVDATTGHRFKFDHFGSDHARNQSRYEHIGDLVLEHIERLLISDYHCTKVRVPINAKDNEAHSHVYLSSDFYRNDGKLLVIIQGSGAVRPGVWARALVINESLRLGSMFPYLVKAREDGYAFIILNPNQNYGVHDGVQEVRKRKKKKWHI